MTLRIGFVGCGGMGKQHLRILRELDQFKVVALSDVSTDALAACGEEFGVADHFSDCGQMCDAVRPDLVVVATQTRHHHGPSLAALERGIHVLCEKPMAIDPVEADDMVAAAAASGANLSINQQNHVNPAVRRAREMIDAGDIGEVVLVRGRNKHGRKSGNEFTEMGTHVTDIMLVVGGMQSLTGAVVGVVVLSVVIDVLRRLEAGIGSFSLPTSSAEVGVGLIMLLILLFRPSGITGNAEIYWPFKGDISSSGAMKRQS